MVLHVYTHTVVVDFTNSVQPKMMMFERAHGMSLNDIYEMAHSQDTLVNIERAPTARESVLFFFIL